MLETTRLIAPPLVLSSGSPAKEGVDVLVFLTDGDFNRFRDAIWLAIRLSGRRDDNLQGAVRKWALWGPEWLGSHFSCEGHSFASL